MFDTAPPEGDLTARARIRNAALRLFGQHGFRSTTMRQIAEVAGVSPALVVHHFASKQGLREAVDAELADQIRAGKLAALTGAIPFTPDVHNDQLAGFADAFAYLGRTLAEGDDVGERLFDRLLADAIEYLEAGVEAGIIRPTDHPRARAVALVSFSLSSLVLDSHLQRAMGTDGVAETRLALIPAVLELFTGGILTDDRLLQSWRDHRGSQ